MATRLCEEEIGFRSGVAIALAILARQHDRPTEATDILQGLGLSIADLKAADVDEYDLAPLRKAMSQGH